MAKVDVKTILYSKEKSPLEFNFEQLQAPPLSMFIPYNDVQSLNNIASSVRYSSKIELKYREINKIMSKNGFRKLASGTNRIAYVPYEDNRFVVKIAFDKVGLRDNPDEMKNQELLKPFITKVFDMSPCGTIASFERIIPITSREEFRTIAEDVFELLVNNIIGKYILEDVGSKYFMNWGTRIGYFNRDHYYRDIVVKSL